MSMAHDALTSRPVGEVPVDVRASLHGAATSGYAQLFATATNCIAQRRAGLPAKQRAAEAEEVVQEAIRRALANADEFDPTRSPIAWISGFILNVSAEASRGSHRTARRSGPEVAEVEHLLADVAEESIVQRYGPLLDAALARLADPDRRLLTLVRDEHLNGRQLAQRLGLPTAGAARVARHRATQAARAACQQILAERGEELIR